MPFTPTDSYITSGDVKLFNRWVPAVTKYDTSSFYNWEQDNLPLYDLDERTHYLWERAGFPGSAVDASNGMALAVSADATTADLLAFPNLFTTVSGAVKALPEVIRFPIIIEVASHGDLGELNLDGIKFEYNGALEIVNRNFAKSYAASSTRWGVAASSVKSAGKYPHVLSLSLIHI